MSAITNLPFVRNLDQPRPDGRRRLFWSVTPTDDYAIDCRIGHRYAIEYIRFERDDSSGMGVLQMIVGDMPRELSGIEIGFLVSVGRASRFGLSSEEAKMYGYVHYYAGLEAGTAKKAAERTERATSRRLARRVAPG